MAEPFVRLLPLSGFPGVTSVYRPLLFKRRIAMPHTVHLYRLFIVLFHYNIKWLHVKVSQRLKMEFCY